MAEHTPGPWFYDAGTGSIGCAAGWIVGPNWHDKKGDGEFGDRDADGYLIAAAPDLLAALKELEDYYIAHRVHGSSCCTWCGGEDGEHADDCPFAVIAKAKREASR